MTHSAGLESVCMSEWRTASTGRRPDPPNEEPDGDVHAYREGSDTTACGISLDGLERWDDRPFRLLAEHCRRCSEQVAKAT